jgi:hypothetical protein
MKYEMRMPLALAAQDLGVSVCHIAHFALRFLYCSQEACAAAETQRWQFLPEGF